MSLIVIAPFLRFSHGHGNNEARMEGMSAAPPVASTWAIGRIDWRGAMAPVGAGLLVLLVGANSGGYFPTTWGWAGVALAWVAALALLLAPIRLGRLELASVGAL